MDPKNAASNIYYALTNIEQILAAFSSVVDQVQKISAQIPDIKAFFINSFDCIKFVLTSTQELGESLSSYKEINYNKYSKILKNNFDCVKFTVSKIDELNSLVNSYFNEESQLQKNSELLVSSLKNFSQTISESLKLIESISTKSANEKNLLQTYYRFWTFKTRYKMLIDTIWNDKNGLIKIISSSADNQNISQEEAVKILSSCIKQIELITSLIEKSNILTTKLDEFILVLNEVKINKRHFKKIDNIKRFISSIVDLINYINNVEFADPVQKLNQITEIVDKIGIISAKIDSIKFLGVGTMIKLDLILVILYKLAMMSWLTTFLLFSPKIFFDLMLVEYITEFLVNISTNISNIKLNVLLTARLKIRLMRNIITSLMNLMLSIALNPASIFINTHTLVKAFILTLIVNQLKLLINSISGIKVGLFSPGLYRKMKIIKMVLKEVIYMIRYVSIHKVSKKAIAKLGIIVLFIKALVSTIVSLLLLTPILILLIIAAPVILLGMYVLVSIIKLISLTARGISVKSVAGIAAVTLIVILLTGMIAALLLMITMAENLIENAWVLLKTFAFMSLIILAIVGIGILVTLAIPVVIPATLGFASLTILTASILLTALSLRLLQTISLDKDKILQNVDDVISTCKFIIDSLWTDQKVKNTGIRGGWMKTILNVFVKNSTLLQSILSSIFLTMSFIAITMILFIAVELKLIQLVNLDGEKIKSSVDTILNTSMYVIDSVFENNYGDNINPSNKHHKHRGFLGTMFKGIADILETIMVVAKVALTMIAVGLIVLMALELRLIQSINLDKESIINNTHAIMSAADAVVSAIFNPGETQPENNGPGKKFLGFIKNTLKGIGNIIESVVGIGKVGITLAAVGMVALLAQELKSINDISNEVNKQQILDNTDLILTVSDEIVKKVFNKTSEFNVDENKIKSFNKVTDSLDKFIKVSNKNADNLEKNINNTIKFVDKIDSVKIENLKTAANMFEKMADFSKSINGNFEGLADVIEDKIMPLLEKLNETFENTNKVIENGASIPSSAPATTAPVVSAPAGGQGAQVGAQAPVGINYSAAIDEIRQELSKIHDALTDGSQITRIDD